MPDYARWLSFGERTEHPGALRVDIRPVADEVADIRALPYADECFDGVECYHVLEHLVPHEAQIAVRELWRVLKPGGVLMVAVPNLLACATALLRGDMAVLNNIYSPDSEPAQRHRWGYVPATLAALLREVGFVGVTDQLPHEMDPNELRLRAVKRD